MGGTNRAFCSTNLLMLKRILLCVAGAIAFTPRGDAAETPIQPKVVVVTMFEQGADTGDAPGELQFWVEREKLDRVIPLPAAHHDVRANADGSVIAILTGGGNTNAAASITALGLDPRFDLRQSYWLVAGIAGIDPADGSVGSAVWTDYVVEGDLAHEIDAREIPAGWVTGYVPLGKTRPYEPPPLMAEYVSGQHYQLNPQLVRWAFEFTRDTPLADNEKMRRRRAAYTDQPNARRPPFVLVGANLASSTYWHGRWLNQWANAWVSYYAGGNANYVTTAMEDSGTLRALTNLTRAGKADVQRALVLRTASNYDMQWPGGGAAESMSGKEFGIQSGYLPSLEAAYRVGSRVVHAIVADWQRYAVTLPAPVTK
jgi:purine nucleoside permease